MNRDQLAAPVWNHEGATIAAVGIFGPVTRLTRSRLPDLSTAVTDIAAAISAEMGFLARSLPEPGGVDQAV